MDLTSKFVAHPCARFSKQKSITNFYKALSSIETFVSVFSNFFSTTRPLEETGRTEGQTDLSVT
jgi:hypothetical protein